MLRQIVQASDENFQAFLMRIREQANNCGFRKQSRLDEEVLDQIVFGTNSETLRAELLKSEISLKEAIDKAKKIEGVSSQMKVFTASRKDYRANVNRVGGFNARQNDVQKRCYNCGYYGHVTGSTSVEIRNGEAKSKERIYIAPFGRENLLGKQSAEKLGLLQVGPCVREIRAVGEFPKIKNCLVKVTIDRNKTPVVVTYRRLPLVVEDNVLSEFKLMDMVVIEKVHSEKITWIPQLLAIRKEYGEYRIVVDMIMPNTAVSREYYPQPTKKL